MHRRACLGNSDDAWTIGLVVGLMIFLALCLAAYTWGWARGSLVMVAVVPLGAFHLWRRRHWNRFVRRQSEVGLVALEQMLGRQEH